MILDLLILTAYCVVFGVSKPERRTTSLIVCIWFLASFIVACFQFDAIITFPIYWCLAGTACILITLRGSGLVLVGMGSMFILQLLLCLDTLFVKGYSDLYLSYGLLSLILNIILILLTFLHGRGLDSVGIGNRFDNNYNNHNSH